MRIKRLLQFLIAGMIVVPALCYGQNDLITLLQEAEQGDGYAQSSLGYMYAKGQGLQQDYLQAAYWWKKAATKGDADAQYNLGLLYESGKGVPQDRIKAAKSWRRAAEKGNAKAQWRMSVCYTDGKWIKPNPGRAAHWASLAMKSGYTGNSKGDGGQTSDSFSDRDPDFTLPFFGSTKLPIITKYFDRDAMMGRVIVDLSKTRISEDEAKKRILKIIEKSRRTMSVALVVGKAPPKGAKYNITKEIIENDIYTIECEWWSF